VLVNAALGRYPMTSDDTFLKMEDILKARRDLNSSIRRNAWRPMLLAIVWGTAAAVFFICVTWLSGFIDPIKSNRTYWLAGVISLIFFGSWPVLDFVRQLMFHRRSIAAIEARIRAGENVPRPNPSLNTDASTSGAPVR
jgi:hypothetical protein